MSSWARSRLSWSRATFVVLLAVVAGWVAWTGRVEAGPLESSKSEELELIADRVQVDFSEGKAELRGNVRARVGALKLQAGEVSLRYAAGAEGSQVRWVRARGGVRARLEELHLEAPELTLDVPTRRAELAGGVHIRRGKTWIRAKRARVNLRTKRLQLDQVRGNFPLETLKQWGVDSSPSAEPTP